MDAKDRAHTIAEAAAAAALRETDLVALAEAVPVAAVQGERYPDMSSIDA